MVIEVEEPLKLLMRLQLPLQKHLCLMYKHVWDLIVVVTGVIPVPQDGL